jgi:hypothetical protein
MRNEFAAVRTEFRSEIAAVRAKIASVRGEIRAAEHRVVIRLGGMPVVMTGILLAVKFLG